MNVLLISTFIGALSLASSVTTEPPLKIKGIVISPPWSSPQPADVYISPCPFKDPAVMDCFKGQIVVGYGNNKVKWFEWDAKKETLSEVKKK